MRKLLLPLMIAGFANEPGLRAHENVTGFDSTDLWIGTEPQLFVDNWIIESVQGIKRRWHKPVRHGDGPVLAKDKPWEMFPYFSYANYSVLRDPKDGLFKCWWEDACMTEPGAWPHRSRLLYAESRDGIHWEKPELEIVLHNGKPTNVIAGHDFGHGSSDKNPWPNGGIHGQAVIIDPDPPTPEERFRMIFFLETDRPNRRLVCAHSADGKHWRPYASRPTLGSVTGLGDVCTLWYDADNGDFVMNTRHPYLSRAAHHDYWLAGEEDLDHPEARDLSTVRFAMGLATLRKDGFCSLDTGDVRPGVISTRPVSSPGTTLFINARCREGGSIRVTLTDQNGQTLEGCELEKGDPFTGDDVRHKVTWQGRDLVPGANTFRRVVFHLKSAEVFSFRFALSNVES